MKADDAHEKNLAHPSTLKVICQVCKSIINANKAHQTHMGSHKSCFLKDGDQDKF